MGDHSAPPMSFIIQIWWLDNLDLVNCPQDCFFSETIRPRKEVKEELEAKRVFELGCNLPLYEPSPLRLIEIAHPLFVSWWQEWRSHIFSTPVHPLCQNLQP